MKDLPLGDVSLNGKLLLSVINDELIYRWKADGLLEDNFSFALVVAFSKTDSPDYVDLVETIGLNEAIVYHRACVDWLNAIHPAEFLALCHQLKLEPRQTRAFLCPEGSALARLIGKLTIPGAIELGSFHYDGNLTVEYLEPYKCMEAKDASKKKGKACLL